MSVAMAKCQQLAGFALLLFLACIASVVERSAASSGLQLQRGRSVQSVLGGVGGGSTGGSGGTSDNGTDFTVVGLGENCTSGGNLKPVLCAAGLYCDAPPQPILGTPGSNPDAASIGVCRKMPGNSTGSGNGTSTLGKLGEPCFAKSLTSSEQWGRKCDFGLDCLVLYPAPSVLSSATPPGNSSTVASREGVAGGPHWPSWRKKGTANTLAGFCFSAYDSPRANPSSRPGEEGSACTLPDSPTSAAAAPTISQGVCQGGLTCTEPASSLNATLRGGEGSGVCVNGTQLMELLPSASTNPPPSEGHNTGSSTSSSGTPGTPGTPTPGSSGSSAPPPPGKGALHSQSLASPWSLVVLAACGALAGLVL